MSRLLLICGIRTQCAPSLSSSCQAHELFATFGRCSFVVRSSASCGLCEFSLTQRGAAVLDNDASRNGSSAGILGRDAHGGEEKEKSEKSGENRQSEKDQE